MTDLDEAIAQIEAERPEFERIMEERRLNLLKLDMGRKKKSLCCIPKDTGFTERDGNTKYEVADDLCIAPDCRQERRREKTA